MRPGILLIRPDQHSDPLELALRDLGYPVYQQAVMDILPLPAAAESVKTWCHTSWHGVIVISPNAARIFAKQLDKQKETWPQAENYYTVGSGTCEVLMPLCQKPITYPAAGYTSEHLLALPELAELKEQKWLIITGKNGRQLLADTLSERGAQVTIAEVYERRPNVDDLPKAEPLWQENVEYIVVSSVEQLRLFFENISDATKVWAQGVHWVVPRGRIGKQLTEFGVPSKQIHGAENATPAALTHTLQLIRESQAMSASTSDKKTDENASAAKASAASTSGNENSSSKPPKPKPTAKPKRGWFGNFLIFILLLSVLVLTAGGYWLWQQQQALANETASQLTSIQERLTQAEQNEPAAGLSSAQQTRVQQELAAMREEIQQQLDRQFANERQARERGLQRLDNLRQDSIASLQTATDQNARQITQVNEALRASNARQSSHWHLLEAFDLVGAAIQRLNFEYNRTAALQLLRQAEALLSDSNAEAYQQIIRQMQRDIEMIEALPQVNTQEIGLRLQRMQPSVRNLPISPDFSVATDDEEQAISSDMSNWRENITQAWESFSSDLIKVQRHDGVPMRLDNDQRALITSRIELQLQIAQQAAMNYHGDYYRNTIDEALYYIDSFFDLQNREVIQLKAELTALRELPIEPEYPTGLLTHAMLRDRVDSIRNSGNGE
ncbi:hypothetical protein CWE08_11085 [Aliidiomarina iranensis]|uniref:Tetrapyrrole biosynthesis uroporphyrinogen III synthase domain-containing protein n=1 Tax=Aliidiomarina iranensis TaxID=1434071 RepID=A0A432VR73_9GAMM|nr:uroporphyrinogen-III C-methyltransferase [Aliidiomarina iranensis]RUO18766.1 hypothetical protein CWE08_11085 [Aliidiomarina iranensis]